jgi:hypothetical protein
MTVNPSLPTPMQILNAFDGVSLEQLQIIIQELRDAAANDDNQDSSDGAQKAPAQQKEPILEL